MSDIDKELTAMKRIANALQSLDEAARLRVMTWIISAHEQTDSFEQEDETDERELPRGPEEILGPKKAAKKA